MTGERKFTKPYVIVASEGNAEYVSRYPMEFDGAVEFIIELSKLKEQAPTEKEGGYLKAWVIANGVERRLDLTYHENLHIIFQNADFKLYT